MIVTTWFLLLLKGVQVLRARNFFKEGFAFQSMGFLGLFRELYFLKETLSGVHMATPTKRFKRGLKSGHRY